MNPTKKNRPRKVLAVASGGGHWVQLLRLRDALAGEDVTYVTTVSACRAMVPGAPFRVVVEATRKNKFRLALLALQMLWIMLRVRPAAVVTTGAAPGFFAIRFGRWFGARTLWIDSIANAEEMSLSGQLAVRHADVVLTQWSHLAVDGVVHYHGAVI
jgi:hypothetical protein